MPGEKFTIQYGGGKTVSVTALAGRQQRELTRLLSDMQRLGESGADIESAWEAAEKALAMCVGDDKAAELWASDVDFEIACDIAGKTLGKQRLSEDEQKKSESPH